MNKLIARIALIVAVAASPALVLANAAGKDDKTPADKADGKKAPPKKEGKDDKKAPPPPAPTGW